MTTLGILLASLGIMLAEGEDNKWICRVGWAIFGGGIYILIVVVNR